MNKSFRQVQSVLDRNRILIQQVNENQQSRMHDNMVKNVSLIQELNGNINKVVSLYSDLNSSFTNVCQQRYNNTRDK
ncbi:Protein EARLY FLOWERING 4 [Sesbania bispinosa]|nr:Protein EARLY FLOWERING 4 [Sesbania bispinosa]